MVREVRGSFGFKIPPNLIVSGMKDRKKPSLHESGQNKSIAPVALVQATTAWSVRPVKLVCLSMKTTKCRTLALALDIEVPTTKNWAKA
jgi:hypothetical protein